MAEREFKLAQKLTDNPEAVQKAAKYVVLNFADDNVRYLELRSTPRAVEGKMTKVQYIEAVIAGIFERFLFGIRSNRS